MFAFLFVEFESHKQSITVIPFESIAKLEAAQWVIMMKKCDDILTHETIWLYIGGTMVDRFEVKT